MTITSQRKLRGVKGSSLHLPLWVVHGIDNGFVTSVSITGSDAYENTSGAESLFLLYSKVHRRVYGCLTPDLSIKKTYHITITYDSNMLLYLIAIKFRRKKEKLE